MAAPKFSELFHMGRVDDLFRIARKSTKLIFWSTVPLLATLILFGKSILHVLFGRDFAAAYPAMVILVLGQFVNSISGSTGYFMNMTGHQKVFRNIVFLAAVINVSLCWALIPPFGIEGASIAGMVSLVFWNVCILVFIKIKYGKTIGYVPVLS
jgi:O-antigen/teichoic acid export membrane protein